MNKTITVIILVALMAAFSIFLKTRYRRSEPLDIDTPSPALGKAVATAIHQTLTDPYFLPLEKLANFLARNPGLESITVDQLTKWAPDDELPICFVWQTDGSRSQLDRAVSPFVLEQLMVELRDALNKPNPKGQLYIASFTAEGEKWWLGFLPIPLGSVLPRQMAGVFFSMDNYLNRDVPRLIDDFVSRPRFPLVAFEKDTPGLDGVDGDIAFRILKSDGEIFLQSGRTFTAEKMIYSESKYNPPPVIVAMQRGWDLQVFSSKAGLNKSDK